MFAARSVLDIDGLLVSAFVFNFLLSLVVLLILRVVLKGFDLWRFVWNPPLMQFGILICLQGLFTLLF